MTPLIYFSWHTEPKIATKKFAGLLLTEDKLGFSIPFRFVSSPVFAVFFSFSIVVKKIEYYFQFNSFQLTPNQIIKAVIQNFWNHNYDLQIKMVQDRNFIIEKFKEAVIKFQIIISKSILINY